MSTARFPGPCAVDDCDGGRYQSGWCSKHYQRIRKHGTPHPPHIPERPLTNAERFESRVDRTSHPDGCWMWTGQLSPDGYAVFTVDRKFRRGSRWAYETFVGEIPEGLVIDHLCRNRACVNPTHLEPVTNRENVLRGISPGAVTHLRRICIRGHAMVGDNVYNPRSNPGQRQCRACQKIRQRARRAEIRARTEQRNAQRPVEQEAK